MCAIGFVQSDRLFFGSFKRPARARFGMLCVMEYRRASDRVVATPSLLGLSFCAALARAFWLWRLLSKLLAPYLPGDKRGVLILSYRLGWNRVAASSSAGTWWESGSERTLPERKSDSILLEYRTVPCWAQSASHQKAWKANTARHTQGSSGRAFFRLISSVKASHHDTTSMYVRARPRVRDVRSRQLTRRAMFPDAIDAET